MIFKKIDFVKILEKKYKLSHKFSLAKKKMRKSDQTDKKIIGELINNFSYIIRHQKSYGGEWEYLNKFKRKKYINALKNGLTKDLENIFSNLFRNDASYGIVTPSFQDVKNKKNFKSQILQDIDASIEFANLKYLNQIGIDKKVGNPYGLEIENKIVMPDSPRHFYFAQKINNIIKNNKRSKFLEIGGGYGGLAKLLFGLNKKITYLSIDLLEGCIIQYYFLKKSGLKVNLVTKAKDIKKNEINLIIFNKNFKLLKKIKNCDFVFNSRSFSEMNEHILNKYTYLINNFLKPKYILHENSNFLLFPKSKRHLEILGKDFNFGRKYHLKQINISPFSGGSGRYREFFFEKK